MALFGPPNIDKLYQAGNIQKLLNVLRKGKGTESKVQAREALQRLAKDEEKRQDRQEHWTREQYAPIPKLIEKLDSAEQKAIAPLTQLLLEEKEDCERKADAHDRAMNELREQFEQAFHNKRNIWDRSIFDELLAALGENRTFLYTKQLGSDEAGMIVTEGQIIVWLFRSMTGHRTVESFPIGEIETIDRKEKWLNKHAKITFRNGTFCEFYVEDEDEEMMSYIERERAKADDAPAT